MRCNHFVPDDLTDRRNELRILLQLILVHRVGVDPMMVGQRKSVVVVKMRMRLSIRRMGHESQLYLSDGRKGRHCLSIRSARFGIESE